MQTSLKIKLNNNNNNLDEIFDLIFRLLNQLGETGDMIANLRKDEKTCEIIAEGDTIVDKADVSSMFNETYSTIFSDCISHAFPDEIFMINLEIKDFSSSIIHVFASDFAGFFYSLYDDNGDKLDETLYFVGEKHDIFDENWEPLYYDDLKEFAFDYFFFFRGRDLSFFSDSDLTKMFDNVDVSQFEEQFEEFENMLNF